MDFLRGTLVLIWFIGSIYVGSGGLTSLELADETERVSSLVVDANDTVAVLYRVKFGEIDTLREFTNKSEVTVYKEEQALKESKEMAGKFFPWLNLPYKFLGLLITSFAFGAVGGTIGLLRELVLKNAPISSLKIFSQPMLGGGSGIIVLGISFIIPMLIVAGETEVRPITIVFVSLFAGLFAERFFEWLSSVFEKIFKKNNEG